MKFKDTLFGNIPENWDVASISNITDLVTDYVANGSFASLAENVTYKNEEDEAVLIRLVDYNNDFKGDFVFINEHAYEFLAKSKLYGGEIIISNVGANVGTVFRCPKLPYKMSLAPNSIMVKFKENNDFYYFWLKSRAGQHMLRSIVTGSAQPKFNKTNFRDMLVPVPPREQQDKIALVLKNLEDKIELNKHINKNLESQAQAIFKSWFVDFEPFGGEMPRDWKYCNLEDLGQDIVCGKTPSTKRKEYYGGNIPFVTIPDMHNQIYITETERYLSIDGVKTQPTKTLPKNTICVSCIGTAGLVSLTSKECQTNQQINSIIPKDHISPYYVYFLMKSLSETIIRLGGSGSTIVNLNKGQFAKIEVVIPNLEDMSKFTYLVKSNFEMILSNQIENTRLAALRDTLLPRLMSGEIDVEHIEM